MAAAAGSSLRSEWTAYASLEDARQHVERCQRRQLFSRSPSVHSHPALLNPPVTQLGRHSPCWTVTGGDYPGVYSSHSIALTAAGQLGCGVYHFTNYRLALNCLRERQDVRPNPGDSHGTINPNGPISEINLLNPVQVYIHRHCDSPARSELEAGETWNLRPNSFSFCSRDHMIQHTKSQAKQEAATKGKIFVCSASLVHCCNRRSEMSNLQPLTAANSPDLSSGTWTLTLTDVSGRPRQIVLHDALFTPARKEVC